MTKLRERFDLDQMIVVADGGMLSKDNLALLRSWNCDYVVAARLRSLNKVQTQVKIRRGRSYQRGVRSASTNLQVGV